MYQNIFYDRDESTFHIWDDKHGYIQKEYKPYAYKKSKSGNYTTIYGNKVKKIKGGELFGNLKRNKINLFEADIEPRTRYLIDNYTDSIEPSEQNFCFYDIEVYSDDDTFPIIKKANQPINAITFYFSKHKIYITLLLDPDDQVGNIENKHQLVFSFRTEKKLLKKAIKLISDSEVTVLTGWNSWDFDDPYFFHRIEKVLGKKYLKQLSPIDLMNYNKYKNFNQWDFAGFSCLDYLKIYKNFTYSEKQSYSLDYIANDELDESKIDYDGSLNKLWRDDRIKFLKYNIQDVKLMVKLEEKRNYLDLAVRICHIGHIPYEYITSSLRIIDGAILTYLKKNEVIAPSVQNNQKEKYPGAYVKVPQTGRHEWVYDLDFSSLYPSIICTLKISPETKVGKVNGWADINSDENVELFNQKMEKNKFKEFLKDNEYSISSEGTIYDMKQKGIIPKIIQKWLDIRSEYKDLKKKYGKKGKEDLEKKYDKSQHAYKILANSLYGVMANEYFRFYDIDNVSAITLTGQGAIKYAEKVANEYYNKELDNDEDRDYVIAGDTDSIFISAKPLLKKTFSDKWKSDPVKYTKMICQVIQEYVNEKMEVFAKDKLCIKTFKYGHKFNLKQEWIADAGLFVAKKRYGLHILDDEGVKKDKMEIKGLDIVRSSYPEMFQDFLEDILKMILEGKPEEKINDYIYDFKKKIKEKKNIFKLANPTGVKGINKYSDNSYTGYKKGTPIHVKASINYNNWLKKNNLEKKYKPIQDNSKVKWIYIDEKQTGFSEIAFPANGIPKKLEQYINDAINFEKIFDRLMDSKVQMFYDALNWGKLINNKNTFDSFFN